LKKSVDVLVIGGGASGVFAAISAARKGAKVTLVERGGCLGGMLTAGLVGFTLDSGYKSGIINEFLSEVRKELEIGSATLFEVQKYVLEQMCINAGVEIYLHSQVSKVKTDNRKITECELISKSGLIYITAKAYIDATGDGDIAFMAGCGFDYGREKDSKAQPMSMIALVTGINENSKEFISNDKKEFWDGRRQFKELLDEIAAKYSIGCPSIRYLCDGVYVLSVNQEYGVSGCDVSDLTRATLNARKEVYELVKALRLKAPQVFGQLTLVSTPECIGVREGRRIHGRYTVGIDDMINGRSQENAVCKVRYWVDIHSLDNDGGKGFTDDGVKALPYDIPYDALIPVDIDNLVLAGRCISGDFYAHASYRVMGNMIPVGEAAGEIAANLSEANK